MAVSALVLDLGNVLVFHDNALLFARIAERFSTRPEDLKARLEGGLWDRVNRGQVPGDQLRLELQQRLGVEVTPDEFFDLWCCHFTVNAPMVREVEAQVGKRKLVLLSNTHDLHVKWCKARLPVLRHFDALILSCEVGHVKPEPEIYRRALAATGVPAAEAVFFDDVEKFARGAEAVGMHGRVFTTVEQFRQDLKDL
jgi:putative hydrolase of the HAD superfamily